MSVECEGSETVRVVASSSVPYRYFIRPIAVRQTLENGVWLESGGLADGRRSLHGNRLASFAAP